MAKSRLTKTGDALAIVHGRLLVDGIDQCEMAGAEFIAFMDDDYTKAVRVVSMAANWITSYWNGAGVSEEKINFEFTIRKEKRSNLCHWYAYRRAGGKLYKRYVGKSEDITPERLAKIASLLP